VRRLDSPIKALIDEEQSAIDKGEDGSDPECDEAPARRYRNVRYGPRTSSPKAYKVPRLTHN
jgi:hypothetical protein